MTYLKKLAEERDLVGTQISRLCKIEQSLVYKHLRGEVRVGKRSAKRYKVGLRLEREQVEKLMEDNDAGKA